MLACNKKTSATGAKEPEPCGEIPVKKTKYIKPKKTTTK
jgi:hypothetical protein